MVGGAGTGAAALGHPFSAVLDDTNPPFYTWFADGTINVSYNCLDRHVLAGRGDRSRSTGGVRKARNAS